MQPAHTQDFTLDDQTLTASLELASKHWKIALQDGAHRSPSVHTTEQEGAAERLAEAITLIETTRREWQLSRSSRVVIVYEAGQDGFWPTVNATWTRMPVDEMVKAFREAATG